MSTGENEETLLSGKPHVMIISYPLQGHVNPMVQFSKRLLSRGIKVTLVTTTSLDISPHANSASINIEHIPVTKPLSPGRASDAINEFLAILKTSITRSLPEVIEKQKANGCPVKFLIYDALMPYALDVSLKLGVQGVAFVTHSSAVFAIFYHVHRRTMDINTLQESSSVTLPSLPLLEAKDLPSYLTDIGSYPGVLALCTNQFVGLEKAYGVLFNTFEKLEGEFRFLEKKGYKMSMGKNEETLISSKPHILLVPCPFQGHINPMLQFSRRLVSRGIKVTLVTTSSLDISHNSTSINIEHIPVVTPSSPGRASDSVDEFLARLQTNITRSLPEVIEKQKANGCPVKFLIYDALLPYGLDISLKLGIQGVAFVTHSCAVFAIYYHVYRRTLDINTLEELSPITLPSLPLLGVKDLPSFLTDIGPYQGFLTVCSNQFLGLEKAYGVLFNTFEKLEGEVSNFLLPTVSFLEMLS
ncbi:hypothetical protein POM88_019049 [Heracleum sosnowskyi]|uniref:Glycosyltransferase n=1 Tax=Heracleum sosnowskyi TaxID=360622 RepID=A0AAD8MZS7_9APIA|nr:hypothetical protein POM88_019049 [Heracleum sosnowskyi]